MDSEKVDLDREFPGFKKKFDQATDLGKTLAMAGAVCFKKNAVAALTMGMAPAVGALDIIADMVNPSHKNGEHGPDQFLFAALLTVAAYHPLGRLGQIHEEDGGTYREAGAFEFHPSVILEAMEMFQKITGRNADDVILPPMARAAREVSKDCDKPLADFLASRSATKH